MGLGWAILGTGRFAELRIAPGLHKAHDARPIAVVSRDRERAQSFATEYGVPRAYDSLDAALHDPAIDAVWVATPNGLHRDAVLAAARAGKHVLCEKPLATTVADAKAMVIACRQAGVALGTGFHLRHHPLHVEVRRILHSGDAGLVLFAEAEWSLPARAAAGTTSWRQDPQLSGGGIITATGVHALDLLRFVLDDEIDTMAAIVDKLPRGDEVDSAATCLLHFRRGVVGTVRCLRRVHAPANDLVIEATSVALRVRHGLDEQARGALEQQGAGETLAGIPAGTDLYALEADAFARAVSEGREPNASGLDGLRVVEATAALYESAASGHAVKVTESM